MSHRSDWQPTPEQVDAAAQAIFDSDCTVHQDFTVTWEQADDKHIYRHNAEYALIAARAAAPEPDTTAFEAALQEFLVKTLEHEEAAQWRDWQSFEDIGTELHASRQRLIAMFKDAAR